MPDPRDVAAQLEARADLPTAPEWERLRGYAVAGLPFRSGHLLAMRRFPATSFGPGYTSVWHRDPAGRWIIYQDREPHVTCPRAFGPALDDAPSVPISLKWTGSHRFEMDIDADGTRLHWEVELAATPATRVINAAAAILPEAVHHSPRAVAVMGRAARPLLRAGRVQLSGTVPSGQGFMADLRRIWVIENSAATIDGTELGEPAPLPEQAHLDDLWLPQRGLFAAADSFFEPHDPGRHELVATRRDPARVPKLERPPTDGSSGAAPPRITLYGLPASHPTAAVERALQLKNLSYRRRDRLPVLHRVQHRILFGQGSAPAMRVGGRRLVGTMEIMGALDALAPGPPMFPSDEARARGVVEAARWADVEFQAIARRLAWAAMVACPASVGSVLHGSKLLLPTRLASALSRPVILVGARLNKATGQQVRRDLETLPTMLDRADRLVANGVLDADGADAAALQIAASVALLDRMADIRPMLVDRPVAALAARHFPDYPGELPAGCLPLAPTVRDARDRDRGQPARQRA